MPLSLAAPRFRPLPPGAVRPRGWLASQLQLQADSLSGRLDEVWPDVRDSQWFGGTAEAWERAPYWLDGLVPLAYALNSQPLLEKVHRYLGYVIEHQQEDGWLGPRAMVAAGGAATSAAYDLWGQLLTTKVLAQYHHASGDPAALQALRRNLRLIDRQIDTAPLFNWGQFRWFEALPGLYHAYELQPEQWLLDLAVKLQAQGFDWVSYFQRWPETEPTPKGRWNYAAHVVNNAMAIKAPALWWRLAHEDTLRRDASAMIARLDEWHGMVTGVFTGDECLAGRRPTQGTELCAVVEYMFSLEVLLSVLGDASLGDRLERIAYNALPATFSPDMWSHQYDQQANQVECSIREGRTWNTNGPDANTFGVEPNYGCCTANLSQGWPKFATHLWMVSEDAKSLAAVAYAPSEVKVTLRDVPVAVTLETDYPFGEELVFQVVAQHPVWFALHLRIPEWCVGAEITLPDGLRVRARAGGFHGVWRQWEGTEQVKLLLPARPELHRGHNGAAALVRGPLVYALAPEEKWQRTHEDVPGRELPHGDWEIYPTSPWNYALKVDESTLETDVRFEQGEVGERPFSPEGAPVKARVKARRLPGWELVNGSAGDTPASPAESAEPEEEVTLLPYGCTNLRVTELPTLQRDG